MENNRFMTELFEISKKYYTRQTTAANDVREKSKACVGDLFYTHKIALGLLEHLMNLYVNIPGKTNESISGRLALIASFYIGIDKCEDSIMEGYYAQAAALLRQEYETFCAINEHKNGNRRQGETPNAKASDLGNFGPMYGDLSQLTHVARDSILSEIYCDSEQTNDTKIPVSPIPFLNENNCKYMFGFHILLISEISWELVNLYSEMYRFNPDDDVKRGRGFVLLMLRDCGILAQ